MKRLYTALALLAGAAVPFVLAVFKPSLFNGWFPQWSRFCSGILSRAVSPFPFPVVEIFAAVMLVAVPAYCVVSFIKRKSLWRALSVIAVWVCAFAFAFVWLWGLNYFCTTPSERMGIKASPSSPDELRCVAELYRDRLNAERAYPDGGFERLAEGVARGYNSLAEQYEFISPDPAPPKGFVFGFIESYLGISGIYMPWTGEGCVVADTPAPNLPATMAHELAHRQGAAPEEDANFLGIMACLASDDPQVRYSGLFYAFIYLSNALHEQDAAAHAELWAGLDENVINDLVGITKHYEKYQGPISDVGEAVNDTYLKAMRQPEGVKSYGRVVDLLIAHNIAKAGKY